MFSGVEAINPALLRQQQVEDKVGKVRGAMAVRIEPSSTQQQPRPPPNLGAASGMPAWKRKMFAARQRQ